MRVLMLRNPAAVFGCPLHEGETGDIPDNMGRTLVAAGLARRLDEPPAPPPKVEAPNKIEAIPEPPAVAPPPQPAVANKPAPSPLRSQFEKRPPTQGAR